MTKEELKSILSETKEEFRKGFIALAHSEMKKDQRKFMSLYANLLELAFGKYVVAREG
jgi:ATP-dependent RNA circularization protein (DNA/RNA ligase family)